LALLDRVFGNSVALSTWKQIGEIDA